MRWGPPSIGDELRRVIAVVELGGSFQDALRHLVAWTAREQRAFAVDELPRLIQDATGVDVRAVVDEWLRPLP